MKSKTPTPQPKPETHSSIRYEILIPTILIALTFSAIVLQTQEHKRDITIHIKAYNELVEKHNNLVSKYNTLDENYKAATYTLEIFHEYHQCTPLAQSDPEIIFKRVLPSSQFQNTKEEYTSCRYTPEGESRIRPAHPRVIEHANLLGSPSSPPSQDGLLSLLEEYEDWHYRNFAYNPNDSRVKTIENYFLVQEGDCSERSLLLVSILINLGYDAYISIEETNRGYHAFTTIFIDNNIHEFDRIGGKLLHYYNQDRTVYCTSHRRML